jgi:hypothetical protein
METLHGIDFIRWIVDQTTGDFNANRAYRRTKAKKRVEGIISRPSEIGETRSFRGAGRGQLKASHQ